MTTETVTPTKDSLASFQARKKRWKNARRPRLADMPTSPLPSLKTERGKTTSSLVAIIGASPSTENPPNPLACVSPVPAASKSSTTIPSSYPPIAAKAPTPFGATPTSDSSTKPPNPFSGVSLVTSATKASTTAVSSSYPPMSMKAPTPFGAAQTSSSSAKAPNPFSGVSLVTSATKASATAASSSYPPMSTKAPTPFGAAQTSSSSAKAPNPFSGVSLVTSATKASTTTVSSSYPPMSMKAPTPFGAAQTSSSSAKAPNPFSGVSLVTSATKASTTTASSSYPPMSMKAPTPFGSTQTSSTESQLLQTTEVGTGGESYRHRLIEFYKIHNVSKLDTVDATLEKYKGKEEELFRKLETKYNKDDMGKKSKFPPPSGDGPQCYVEFAVDRENVGRVVVKLYKDKAPLACENFRCLCTGEITRQRQLYYLGSKVHRIVPGFCIQMGDFTRGDGRGGMSIYPPNSEHGDAWGKFKDEPFLQHSKPGLLSMANSGANSNSSQVFFTLKEVPYLDGTHVVFGEVIEGMDVIETIGNLETNKKSQAPLQQVTIAACGEVVDGKDVSFSSKEGEPTKQAAFGFSSLMAGSTSVPAASLNSPFGTSSATSPSSSFGTSTPFSSGGSTTSSTTASFAAPTTSASPSSQTTMFSFGGSKVAGTKPTSSQFAFGVSGSGVHSSTSSPNTASSPSPFGFGSTPAAPSPFTFGGSTSK